MSKTAGEDDPRPGLEYLMQEIPDYWDRRQTIIALLGYLSQKPSVNMEHWEKDAEAAHLLLEALETAYGSIATPPAVAVFLLTKSDFESKVSAHS